MNINGITDMRELFKDYDDCDYSDIMKLFGEILVEVADDGYSGDTRVFLKGKDGRYAHLIYGWGSCSGCDALEACCDFDELNELVESLYNCIIWFDTYEEALHYFVNHDWEGDFCGRDDETIEYIKKVKDHINSKIDIDFNVNDKNEIKKLEIKKL